MMGVIQNCLDRGRKGVDNKSQVLTRFGWGLWIALLI